MVIALVIEFDSIRTEARDTAVWLKEITLGPDLCCAATLRRLPRNKRPTPLVRIGPWQKIKNVSRL